MHKIYPRNDFLSITNKLIYDQFLFAPFIVSTFYIFTPLLEGKGVDDIVSRMENEYITSMMVLIFFNFFQFFLILF